MTKQANTQGLDEILTRLENRVSLDTAQRIQAHKSGQSPKQSHYEAKQAILQWVADEVIGEDEPDTEEFMGIVSTAKGWFTRIKPQNELRDYQRQILKQHGWLNHETDK